ncbi:gfo/Idh/MocA family oxidoreductase [Candidatus Parcubacteria bacterium]|nr:MAG: gfo/Idh/MocA family oxidoreductase [Candidatus Parcubacteria bacterium]
MNHPLRAGIVGYGYMGQIRLRNITDHPVLELAAICDPGCPEVVAAQKVSVYERWEDLVTADLDVVFVCTPNNLIPNVAIKALNNGCHVFCEKPPGRSLTDIQSIRAAELANPRCRLLFGFNHRHHPGIIDAKAIIDSGSLGDILTLRGVYGKAGGYDYHTSWRNDPAIGGGGILLDQGIHMLDLFCLFVGEFSEVIGMRGITAFDIPVEDNAFVLLRTPRGQLAQLHSSATSWKHTFRLEIGCEKGYIVISGLLSKTGSYGRETLVLGRRPAPGERTALGNPREETIYYDDDPSWDIEVAHLVECIQQNKPVEQGTSLDALRVMEIIDRVYRGPLVQRISK